MELASAPERLRTLPTWLINQVSLHAQRLGMEAFTSVGGRRYQYSVLAALDESGRASQAELGRRCGIDRSDMVALVNELSAQDLVQRAMDQDDRRRNVITITDKGRDRLNELDTVVAEVQERLLDPLPDTDRAELVRILTRVLEHQSVTS